MLEIGNNPVDSLGLTVIEMEKKLGMGGIDEWHRNLLDTFEIMGYIDPSSYNIYESMLELGDNFFFGETKRYEDLNRPDPFTLACLDSPYKDAVDRFLDFYTERWMDFEEAATEEIEYYWKSQDKMLMEDLGVKDMGDGEEMESGYYKSFNDQIDNLVHVLTISDTDKEIDLIWEESYSFIGHPQRRQAKMIYQDWMKDNPYYSKVLARRIYEMGLEGNFVTLIIRDISGDDKEISGFFAEDVLVPLTEEKLKQEIDRLGLDYGDLDEYTFKMTSIED